MTPEDKQKDRKQHEITYRVLADTVVNQLISSGCDAGQLIDFASEVLRNITDRGLACDPDEASKGEVMDSPRAEAIPYRLEITGDRGARITGSRVTLCGLVAEDRSLLEGWLREPEIHRTFSKLLLQDLIGGLPELTKDPQRKDFLIRDENDRGIGLVCLFRIEPDVRQAEMAKLLGSPDARGKGYAKEATQLLLCYAFDDLKLRRVYLRTAGFNLHNIKLNERLGFKFEGILRESQALEDKLVDVVLMSMLAREFAKRHELSK